MVTDDATVVRRNECKGVASRSQRAPKDRRFRRLNRHGPERPGWPQQTLVNRVEILQHKMQSLEGLPDRVASLEVQILQFRAEVRVEFSAVREEMRDLGETLRGEMNDLGETLRGEMRGGMNGLAETLRGEIRAGDEETRRQMRVLHEEVISRIALLDEHLNGRKRSPKSRGRTRNSRRSPKR